jgi:hypothetical protein
MTAPVAERALDDTGLHMGRAGHVGARPSHLARPPCARAERDPMQDKSQLGSLHASEIGAPITTAFERGCHV